jgi:hypothetical protein
MSVIKPLDREALRAEFESAVPFRFVAIDSFLRDDFAREVAAAYPTFEEAERLGFGFKAVNERKKVQITDVSRFPEPVKRLHDALASEAFLSDLSAITGIPCLLADPTLSGGGIHVTGPHGRLDVHVDFNLLGTTPEQYRRLNLLVYLNPEWDERWAGELELWDRDVKRCRQRYAPLLNRCVIFETSDISFHGVAPLTCPPTAARKSFAAYYYTIEPPPAHHGGHGTIFRARPDERVRRYVLMPAERLQRRVSGRIRSGLRLARRAAGRAKRALTK